jgi:hypothetical protein
MPTIKSSIAEIRQGAKQSIADRKVSSQLTNGILKFFAALWTMLKKMFLTLFFTIFTQLKKVLPLPEPKTR